MSSSSSSSISTTTASIGIPIAIAAIAFSVLYERYDEFATYFFEQLKMKEQVALLVLLFTTVFCSVGITNVLNGGINTWEQSAGNHKSSKAPTTSIKYPLHEMNQVLSDRQKFAAVYPWLRDSILESLRNNDNYNDDATDYIEQMMDYTLLGGKHHRGTTVVTIYRKIQNRPLTPVEIAQASVLGWTVEFLQAFFLVTDDVMDQSETRRGQPCWYKQPDIQLKAINDAFLLESFVFTIVQMYFRHLPTYTAILELLLSVIQKTELGQLLDLTSNCNSNNNTNQTILSKFTVERYRLIVRYKTAYYSFYLPVALAMCLAGIGDEMAYETAKEICCIMGEYFQIQDDIIDCYGDPKQDMQTGTDIQDCKCSWLIVQALDRGNVAQRKILQANYGHPEETKVQNVRRVYDELKLEEAFQKYQEESYEQIQTLLDQVTVMPKDVFQILLKKIYKRTRVS